MAVLQLFLLLVADIHQEPTSGDPLQLADISVEVASSKQIIENDTIRCEQTLKEKS